MASSSVVFKVFLRSNGSPEARKFIIDDASNITSYLFVKEKIRSIFSQLRNAPFKIIWKDSEGDDITIDTDEDLIMAFTEMTGPVKTLYIHISTRSPSPQNPVSNVICDNCEKVIIGYRYKCLQCPDFDLCIDCEHAGLHSEHYMLRTSTGELPFSGTCKRISETINKSIRRFQGKEACRSAKAGRKFDRKHDHYHHYKQAEEAADIGWRQDTQPGPSRMTSCPMPNAFYEMASAAAQAMSGHHVPEEESTKSPQQPNQEQTPPPQQEQPHFVDIMVKALNNIFGEQHLPATQAVPPTPYPPTPTNPNPKTPTSTPVNEQSPGGATPMEEDVEAMRRTPRRGSWTMLDTDISIQNTPVEQPPQQQSQQSAQQSTQQFTQQFTQQSTQQPTQQPSAPPLDPRLAEGLKQLQEMGFADPDYLVELLKRFDAKVGLVIKYMFDNRA